MLSGGTRAYGFMTIASFDSQAERTFAMFMISANLDRAPIRALPYAPDPECASTLSNAVLLALRDWLTAAEVVELARYLPSGLVPVIFQGWSPLSNAPPRPARAEFIARVQWYLDETPVAECEVAEALMDFVQYLPERLFTSPEPAHRTVHAGGWQ
jgi:uncharacterized protein (DUF2267 family)